MRLPSKVTPHKKSVLSKLPTVIKMLQEGNISPGDLYQKIKRSGVDMAEFIEILDTLFLLGKVDFTANKEMICYVEENPM